APSLRMHVPHLLCVRRVSARTSEWWCRSWLLSRLMSRRKFWGWGLEGEGLNEGEIEHLGSLMAAHFGLQPPAVQPLPRIDEVRLREPRLRPPDALAEIFSSDP